MDLDNVIPSAVRFLEDGGDNDAASILKKSELGSWDIVDYWMDGSRQLDGLALELRCSRSAYDILSQSKHPISQKVEQAIVAVLPTDSYLKSLHIKAAVFTASAERVTDTGSTATLSEPPEEDVQCWSGNCFRLFISHIHEHRSLASEIQNSLKKYLIQGFVAHADIKPTSKWEAVIQFALKTCHSLCALLTEGFHGSAWTDQEIGVAMGRGLLIIPVRLGVDPYGFIGKFQGLQGEGKDGFQVADDMVDILLAKPQTSAMMSRILALALVKSRSYKDTMAIIGMLEKIRFADETVVTRIESAMKDNHEVYETYTGRERLERLLERL